MQLPVVASTSFYGIPDLRNFSRSQYSGGIQNWSFTEAPNGLLYFANNSGMLEYDGTAWSIYQGVTAVNRVVLADGGRIYVGAFNEFGYYSENERGNLIYHSLAQMVKGKVGDFDEIWRIHKTPFGIVFQSFKAIFILANGRIDIVRPRSSFQFSYYVNGILWVYDASCGLMQYRNGKVEPVPGGDFFTGTPIWSMLPLNDHEILIGTNTGGAYRFDGKRVTPWGGKVNEQLKKYQLYSSLKLKNKLFAFGTIQNGLIISDTAGNLVLQLNRERGLQNNTVLGIGQDNSGNIWLCLDNGITLLDYNSPISYVQKYFDIGTGYASAKFAGQIYLGTNQGLFHISEKDFLDPSKSNSSFRLIAGTEGQVWDLTVIDNTLLCGHTNGIFQVIGDQAIRVSSQPGTWNFLKIDNAGHVLAGTYTGMYVLENHGGRWRVKNKIFGFDESSRFVQYDSKGNIWVSQTYTGIFRIRPDRSWTRVLESQQYTSKSGLPSDRSNLLFRIQSNLVVATEKGVFRYNYGTRRFEPDEKYSPYFPRGLQVDYLYQDPDQNIWFIADRQLGVLRIQEDGSFKKITVPFQKLTSMSLRSFEDIKELDRDNVLIGIEGGFAHYTANFKKDYSTPGTIYISDLRSGDTSEGVFRYNGRQQGQGVVPAFRYRNNKVAIAFSANNAEPAGSKFQYKLSGYDENWSEWSSQSYKEYMNLHEGHYTFMVRAGNPALGAPTELSYSFIVLPPWYRSVYAWITYFLLSMLTVFLGGRYFSYRIEKSRLAEKEKQKVKYLSREQKLKEEALFAENEMARLRNETLRLEMIHKEKELANSTMLLIKKNNILSKLQADLRRVNSSLGNDSPKGSIESLIKRIDKEIDNEKQWKVFDLHIEQVYEELFRKLKDNYPDLTPRELSLCAYLRMNISSKEIATLMNISARGVEISRYRIRKKLKLGREANLTEFMINL